MSSTSSVGSDRPDHPVFAACSTLDGRVPKKIPFRSAKTITVSALKERISQTFSLATTSAFHIAYHDDEEGDDCLVQTEDELTDAIWYFMSGSDEDDITNGNGHRSHSNSTNVAVPKRCITLQFQVVFEYNGPSLSDTSSLAGSLPDLDDLDLEDEYASSAYTSSSSAISGTTSARGGSGWNGYRTRRVRDEIIAEESESSLSHSQGSTRGMNSIDLENPDEETRSHRTVSFRETNSSLDLSSNPDSNLTPATSGRPRDLAIQTRSASPYDHSYQHNPFDPLSNQSLYRPGRPASISSSSITSSELGARWIEEQKARVARKIGSRSSSSSSRSGSGSGSERRTSRRSESEDEQGQVGTEYEEGKGSLALKVDGRGKWHYAYTSSDMTTAFPATHNRASTSSQPRLTVHLNGSTSTFTTSHTDRSGVTEEPFEEPAYPPSMAPDCSACDMRLEYMRYVCTICGPGKLYSAAERAYLRGNDHDHDHEVGTVLGYPNGRARRPSSAGENESDGESTTSTRRASSVVRHPLDNGSDESLCSGDRDGDRGRSLEEVVSPLAPSRPLSNPFASSDAEPGEGMPTHEVLSANGTRNRAFDGFELCPGCIEVHGIDHTRMMGLKAIRHNGMNGMAGKLRRFGVMDHTYREMIWSATGWRDIKYMDDANCSICNANTEQNRFKCATCPEFNLCRSCHQNVQEIHPTHAFLAVPDRVPKLKPPASVFLVETSGPEISSVIHPGAFCHNCLRDIRGSRFHCTTCPAWDLCRDCQTSGTESSGAGPHLPDHLMLEIPLPLPSHSLHQLADRARHMWLHQDSVLLANGEFPGQQDRRRAASPDNDNETIYGGAIPPPRASEVARTPRRRKETLEHDLVCQGCSNRIRGRRFQCVNCPSDPVGYNLCASCETRSHLLHDPMHVFAQFTRRAHFSLRSGTPLLPILYRKPVGEVRSVVDPSNPTAYLEHVVHHSTLCDIHVGPIQGPWLRCAHCASSFDICRACETVVEHDPTHIFLVLKAEVNMPLFRGLASLSEPHNRPLISQRVYA